jgi:hypothetical protein
MRISLGLRKKWENRNGWSVDRRALTEAERDALIDGVLKEQ